MQKKILSDQTLEELKITKQKQQSILIVFTLLLCTVTGIIVYLTLEKGIKLYTFLPVVLAPFYIYSLLSFKKVRDEIKSRTAHIFHQRKMKKNR